MYKPSIDRHAAIGYHSIGKALEKITLQNSLSLFKQSASKFKTPPTNNPPYSPIVDKEEKSNWQFFWRDPPENALPVEFCKNSSIHGLPFIVRPKLHLSERIFWTIAFILGVVAAVLLINDVWVRYNENPVIVTFQAEEVDIDMIPFPSVTICSMNAFPKSEVRRLQKIAQSSEFVEANEAREALKYVREVCNSQFSFAEEFNFAYTRGHVDTDDGTNETIVEHTQNQMMDFLLKHTTPCENLIRLCILEEHPVECGTLFKPLITDYGKCCSFNILPIPLLLQNPQGNSMQNTSQNLSERWSNEELNLWRSWDYDKDGFTITNKSQARPYRQKRAGMPYGLSILVDANLDDWHCPVSDSEGFRFLLQNSLDIPQVEAFASLIALNQEIMIEIHPEMTNAEDDIRAFSEKIRHCYYPEERQLQFYGPYTAGNCFAECTALVIAGECNCTYWHMPRNDDIGICNSDPHSSNDYKCIRKARETVKTQCKHCESLCEYIEYKFETTAATLQDPLQLWNDPNLDRRKELPTWANNKMSLIHIFVGSDTTVPKLRKRLYGTTDLIANTGGILGLCLGFSVLSVVELVYFMTMRTFWRICWKKRSRNGNDLRKLAFDTKAKRKEDQFQSANHRIIQLNPTLIPVISHPPGHHYWVKGFSVSAPLSNSIINTDREMVK